MAKRIKVYISSDEEAEIKEVNLEEAEKLIEEAYARGRLVVDRKEGIVISEISPEVEEILIIEEIFGG